MRKQAKLCIVRALIRLALPAAIPQRPGPSGQFDISKDFFMKHILLLMAFGAGCCLPVQAGINTLLRRFLGEPMQAALVSFAVGTLALWIYSLAARHTWPSISQLSAVPWWMWTGGVLGAIFVSCTIFLAPRLGAATMTAVMLSGQLVASVLLDHYALVGFPEHPVSPLRLAGIALLFAGAWLVRVF